MITSFFIPELNSHDVQELWFQQDGATYHTARATIDLLKDAFATRGLLATDHVILNHGQVTWTTPELAPPLLTTTPHQREDVSALDRFNVHRCPTWRVFSGTGLEPVTKQATVDTYTTRLPRPPQMLGKVIENWTSRLDYIRASRGSHMPEIIFKM
ncbi:uncharacterized protein TNCV_2802441 [Trichonephila clavipes]|nr:uncharacterized protein TNCV_2802441 [Trichonephila clavipes]